MITVLYDGPAPVISNLCEQLGVRRLLDRALRWDEVQCKLSPGQRLVAILINVLLSRQPLYRVELMYSRMDVEKLFGRGITWRCLNDDALARALDKLAEAGPEKVYQALVLEVLNTEGVTVDALHADTTSVSVHGEYDIDDDSTALNLTFGFSKDKRPDLKQFMYGLGVTRDGVPVVGEVLDGNKPDVKWNRELLKKLPDYLQCEGRRPVYVADSSLISKKNLQTLFAGEYHFISRLPRRFNLEQQLVTRAWQQDDWESLGALSDAADAARYRIYSVDEEMYGQSYRFVVVHSSSLDGRKTKSVDRRVEKAEEQLSGELDQLAKREFACEPDALEACREFEERCVGPFFCVQYQVQRSQRRKKRKRPGRPPKDYVPQYEEFHRVVPRMKRNAEYIKHEKEKASCFVLISKPPPEKRSDDEYILKTYKEQTVVEQHFAFIKDPRVVGPVYLKKPERVEALAYVFLMSLLVYSILQRRVRRAMKKETQPLILHGGVKSKKPTGRRILELLNHMLVIKTSDGTRVLPDNIPVPERILRLLKLPQDTFTRLPDT